MKTIDLRMKMPSNFSLLLVGDVHEGNAMKDDKFIKHVVDNVRSGKNIYVAFGGDMVEAITVTDKRYDVDIHTGKIRNTMSIINRQIEELSESLDKIADRILWLLNGNHEFVLHNIYDINYELSRRVGIEHTNSFLVKAIFPGFRLGDWHGSGSILSQAGDLKQRRNNERIILKRKLRNLPCNDCSILCSHHFHRIIINEPEPELVLYTDVKNNCKLKQTYKKPYKVKIDEDNYVIHEDDKYYVCSGSALKGYSEGTGSYVEKYGLFPSELGYLCITVKGDMLKNVEKVLV